MDLRSNFLHYSFFSLDFFLGYGLEKGELKWIVLLRESRTHRYREIDLVLDYGLGNKTIYSQ